MKLKNTGICLKVNPIPNVHCGLFDGAKNIVTKGVCLFKNECCNDASIPGDITKLRETLNERVFGQHVAVEIVINAIAAHWDSPHAKKPLVMSFHGVTGSGKNFVSQIIAESLYKKGLSSKYVTLFNGAVHFPEKSLVEEYKRSLYESIKGNVSECGKQLFIFDEMELVVPGLLDGIKTVLDYHENVENVDYRQAIFIFLSNIGSGAITTEFMKMWRAGRPRSDIKLSDFESIIAQGSFNALGGFYHSDTIKNNLIDHYVPFLPMEREHVELCVRKEFEIRGIYDDDDAIQEVISIVEWAPSPENKFAKTGCKRLSQKVAALAYKLNEERGKRHEL